eukprot:scaffold128101_cov30-Tisochrysis_lutea.AAC.2
MKRSARAVRGSRERYRRSWVSSRGKTYKIEERRHQEVLASSSQTTQHKTFPHCGNSLGAVSQSLE